MRKWLPFVLLLLLVPLVRGVDIDQRELDNGLQVILVRNPTVPLVTIEIAVKTGATCESPEYDGLAHLYEHMFFKGNKTLPTQEAYKKRVRELGIIYNGATSTERVYYFITLGSERLEEGLKFMNDAICYPLFKEEELERERKVVLNEYDRYESQPEFHFRRNMDKLIYWEYFVRHNTIGFRDVIATATPEKMRYFQRKYYNPNNSALIICGDIEQDKAFKLAKRYFSSWKRGQESDYNLLPQHPPIEDKAIVITEKPTKGVATLVLRMKGPQAGLDPQATFAADVFNTALNHPISKFQKALVDSGFFFDAIMSYYTQRYGGEISFRGTLLPEKIPQAQRVLFSQVERFKEPDYVTPEELEMAKRKLEIDILYQEERSQQFVHTLGFWWNVGGGSLDYYQGYLDNAKKISRKDINGYLDGYLLGKNYILGLMVPEGTKLSFHLPEPKL